VEATLEELRAKNYSFNYKQYLPQSAVEVEGFEMVKLGVICHTKNGFAIKSENMTKNASDYPVIKVKNLQDGTGRLMEDNDRVNIKLRDEFIVKRGDVLIVMVGNTAGKMAVWEDKDAYLNQNIHKIHFNEKALPRYVYYILNSQALMEQILPLSSGTAQPFISPSVLYEIQIPLPSLERQQQIVEAIDGWASLAQQEEVALKILEKQMMFQVKEMGRGQARVKLGEVCEWQMGKRIVKDQVETGNIPVYGGGGITFYTNTSNRSGINCKISREGMSEANCVLMITGDYHQNSQGMTIVSKDSAKSINPYIWYWLIINKESVYECGQGTAQKAISMIMLNDLEIPLPPLTEQQTLESDFDEIRHKHAKIAVYKAKAQEATQRLIPGATPV